jgi:1,4-dihydroxy-2-naphthoate octaprenyltransferase
MYGSANKMKTWFLETRPQFLILDIVLAMVGTGLALYEGFFNIWYALLALLGLLLAHSSVNILNDYFDYRSGIDLKVTRTPFSGGSGILPAGKMKPRQVLWMGIACLVLAIPIGVYFTLVTGWLLLPLLVVAALCILLYTSVILKTPFPEWAAGLGLGLLPVMGFYFIQTGYYSWTCVIAGIPSYLLVYNLLFLNEFPDVEADKTGDRKTFPILLGRGKASIWYTVTTSLIYIWVIAWVLAGVFPVYSLIVLITLPLAIKAIKGAWGYNDMKTLVPAMANNVMLVLGFQLLLGIGFIPAVLVG